MGNNKIILRIENLLKNPDISNDTELKDFTSEIRKLILNYEKSLYMNYTKEEKDLVKDYRRQLTETIKYYRKSMGIGGNITDLDEERRITENNTEGYETLHLLNRQMKLAKNNNKILTKGTFKLAGLNYTSEEISKGIFKAANKVEASKIKSEKEIRNIRLAFYLLIIVICIILLDKLYLKFKFTKLMELVPEIKYDRNHNDIL